MNVSQSVRAISGVGWCLSHNGGWIRAISGVGWGLGRTLTESEVAADNDLMGDDVIATDLK